MPKFLFFIFILSVGCLCGEAPASENVFSLEPDPFFISSDESLAERFETDPSLTGTPGETVDDLSSRANEWSEPSQHSEVRYVYAIRKWLNSLAPVEQATARKILREAHPRMRALRVAIREKKSQLAAISFDRHTRPETLPRLGQELQALRAALRKELKVVDQRLRNEAGVETGPLGGDGFWLAPPSEQSEPNISPPQPPQDKKSFSIRQIHPVSSDISINSAN